VKEVQQEAAYSTGAGKERSVTGEEAMIGEVVGRLGVVFVVRLGVSILPSLYFRRVFVRFLREKKGSTV
jgi:hypothetical protein